MSQGTAILSDIANLLVISTITALKSQEQACPEPPMRLGGHRFKNRQRIRNVADIGFNRGNRRAGVGLALRASFALPKNYRLSNGLSHMI
jgi:hypothetical protein